ncbi:hypothetical protein CDAR_1821 [Caerostris darwini]|uniref:Uncharacterized protein n=1 Tax=Caerostris darwini TaxID=1538125 RepID=A0AAV4R526_9ARAC|nr:hypothetical protein CDAR_1821 [Caerostris darwini]
MGLAPARVSSTLPTSFPPLLYADGWLRVPKAPPACFLEVTICLGKNNIKEKKTTTSVEKQDEFYPRKYYAGSVSEARLGNNFLFWNL